MDERDSLGRPMHGRTDYDATGFDRSFYDRGAYDRGVVADPAVEARAREVDIRRTAVLGRDYDATGHQHYVAVAPMHKALRWGPIFAGLATSIVASLLIGSLFLGLGFDSAYGVFGGLTADQAGWGASVAMGLAVFIGSMVTGYVSDLRSKAEGVMNGFMVGVMAILTPLIVGIFGGTVAGPTAVNTTLPQGVPPAVEAQVRSALVVAADNAWFVFAAGMLVLGISALGGYLGSRSRERALEADARRDFERSVIS